MSTFVEATFTGTDGTTLTSYTPEVGGQMIRHASFTDTMSIQTNRAGKDTGAASTVYYFPATPPGLEYTIEADIVDIGNVNRASGICGWIDTAADHGIIVRRQLNNTWQFLKVISGAATSIDTEPTAFSAGAVARLRLTRTAGDSFEWFLNGASLGSFTISDSQFQSPGKVGLRASNDHTAGVGYHVDNFLATVPDVGGAINTNFSERHLRPAIFTPGLAR